MKKVFLNKWICFVGIVAILFGCSAVIGYVIHEKSIDSCIENNLNADKVVRGFVDAIFSGDYERARSLLGATPYRRKRMETAGKDYRSELDLLFSELWNDIQNKIRSAHVDAHIERIYFKCIENKEGGVIVWYHVETGIFERFQIGVSADFDACWLKNKVVKFSAFRLKGDDL